ncbi:sugar phosphate isomerase/epimerase family protein [Cohnella candidum]|uniref:Sugar phosphate isomerase/epimerase n=1 Tax=Cohnella candidum TaxID=2674991 RepID=A0A3G3K7U0_9BACL|nr:sugar phosphate isomerase/epimerase family protein [Cohnella candidum]AYQ75809.1 sugar phosphate isomerase/epimerase [Cohnella candidum]
MRITVFTVATPDLEPAQLAAAAKRAGLDGIEWRYQDVPKPQKDAPSSFWGNNKCSIPTVWEEKDLEVFREAAARSGIQSAAVVPYLTPGDMAGTERVLRAARYLGASFIRLGVHVYDRTRPFAELFAQQRRYLKQAEELCRAYGIKGIIETHHGTIAPTASAAYRLVEECDPAHIGVLYDPGNMVYEGYENYRMGMEILGPYLAHVHAKNAAWEQLPEDPEDGVTRWRVVWAGLKKGVVDWKQVIDDLRAVGYKGCIGIEDFSGQWGTEEMLANFAGSLRKWLDPK